VIDQISSKQDPEGSTCESVSSFEFPKEVKDYADESKSEESFLEGPRITAFHFDLLRPNKEIISKKKEKVNPLFSKKRRFF
jgi:hypothetical protein